ncbi:retrovirus-related Pol polyprotein from transposon 412 [Trichonephila clavipes]|nr:retrovirus-related Pol polyprotein from transposon 412 [Trichonephila clavipes]
MRQKKRSRTQERQTHNGREVTTLKYNEGQLDEEPVCQPPSRLAFTERQEVNKQTEEWLNEGIIRPISSEYGSPIVMVKKKDGSSRMCIDYRKLNQKLVKNKFPSPLIKYVLDTLQEAKVHST